MLSGQQYMFQKHDKACLMVRFSIFQINIMLVIWENWEVWNTTLGKWWIKEPDHDVAWMRNQR